MSEPFTVMLEAGGKSNSLGRANEVIEEVLHSKDRLSELYDCLFNDDAWVRMRAADALEKVCREHPDWLVPYIDRFTNELGSSNQASIQWHLAQIYAQVDLTDTQRQCAMDWLEQILSSANIDWIVAANAMDTLMKFMNSGFYPKDEMTALLHVQQTHKSSAIVKRAAKHLSEL